jgi:hypothetical protein
MERYKHINNRGFYQIKYRKVRATAGLFLAASTNVYSTLFEVYIGLSLPRPAWRLRLHSRRNKWEKEGHAY